MGRDACVRVLTSVQEHRPGWRSRRVQPGVPHMPLSGNDTSTSVVHDGWRAGTGMRRTMGGCADADLPCCVSTSTVANCLDEAIVQAGSASTRSLEVALGDVCDPGERNRFDVGAGKRTMIVSPTS